MQFLRTLEIKTTLNRDDLLATVMKNREAHVAGYDEAREGYLEKAQAALNKRLKQLGEGNFVGLSFRLSVPTNHVTEYDTVIGMLTDTEAETITLSAAEYRMLVEDNWDWMDGWLSSNAFYSPLLSTKALEKGLL